jgi:hypothetical protein
MKPKRHSSLHFSPPALSVLESTTDLLWAMLISGCFMKQIPLGGKYGIGRFTLIDDEDFERVSAHIWHCKKDLNTYYAEATFPMDESHPGRHGVKLHRFILGVTDRNIEIDHQNGDGLDNQRDNLRACAHWQNMANKKLPKQNTSGYRGIVKEKRYSAKYWTAKIRVNGKDMYLGSSTDIEKAAHLYDEAAMKYFGEFARLNFPLDGQV